MRVVIQGEKLDQLRRHAETSDGFDVRARRWVVWRGWRGTKDYRARRLGPARRT
jgi:hypothetical protein